MKCEVCDKEISKKRHSVICSDRCGQIRLKIYKLIDKYFPVHGCDNCWGDLGQGCTEKCKKEFKDGHEFAQDLWSIINIIYPRK
jgi:predicted nucleic acid-binding Zn ribbon protein